MSTVIDIKFGTDGHAVSNLHPRTTPEEAQKVVKAMFSAEAVLVRAQEVYGGKDD